MSANWTERVEAYWHTADDSQPEVALRDMRSLIAERRADDPEALYEWASVHDFLGMEREAVPLYRSALDQGLTGDKREQAIIQLASSLRNIGEPDAAIDLLREQPGRGSTGDAAQVFLALALHDSGRHDDALRVALLALARTLPAYRGAVEGYANQLTERREGT